MEKKLPDFSTKIVVFYLRNSPDAIKNGIVLESVSYQQYGDRVFLKGIIPLISGQPEEWSSNLEAELDWDDVLHFIVFESREEYERRLGGSDNAIRKKFFL